VNVLGGLPPVDVGPRVGVDAVALLEHLYAGVAPRGVVVTEALEPADVDAIEGFRARHGVTTPLDRDDAGGLAWSKEEALAQPHFTAPDAPAGASGAPGVA
jgi:hypothetical protein